jgi:hypothetical protein
MAIAPQAAGSGTTILMRLQPHFHASKGIISPQLPVQESASTARVTKGHNPTDREEQTRSTFFDRPT